MQKLQLFAWQSSSHGQDVHVNATPTQSHLAHQNFLEKKEVLKESSSKSMLEKYGGEKYLEKMPRELLGGQTEGYVEYDRRGVVVKGQERAKAKSKYEEDGEFLSYLLDEETNLQASLSWKSLVYFWIFLLTYDRSMGFRLLSFHHESFLLCWISSYRSS